MQTPKSKIAKLIVALFVTLLPWPRLVEAQSKVKVPRIGVMFSGQKDWNDAFRQGLRDLGYIEGKNIFVEHRNPQGKDERYAEIVAELLALKVDVIVVGGNVTGLAIMGVELTGKRLDLLKETVPKATRIAVLWNPASGASVAAFKETAAAAQALSLTLLSLEMKRSEDLQAAFDRLHGSRSDALLIVQDAVMIANLSRIIERANKNRLPAMYWEEAYVEAGGLMSYGPDYADLYRRTATYVDKILKGTRPAELPIERPMKFEFVINLKTAKQIGLAIPPNVLARADRVIR